MRHTARAQEPSLANLWLMFPAAEFHAAYACRAHLLQQVASLGPAYMTSCRDSSSPQSRGWLSAFMTSINATHPHPDHVLVNAGCSAHTFHHYALGACLEDLLPRRPDLLILEHLPHLEDQKLESKADKEHAALVSLEILLHRLRLRFDPPSLPPTIFLNMHMVAYQGSVKPFSWADWHRARQCLTVETRCHPDCISVFSGLPNVTGNTSASEAATDRVASHYGAASLSFTNLVAALMMRVARGAECSAVFSAIFADAVHPSAMGQLLLSELLVGYLASARLAISPDPDLRDPGLLVKPCATAPLDLSTLMVPNMRCFGPTSHEVAMAFHREDVAGYGLHRQAINVTRADGWAHVVRDGGKARPGWVAMAPGSVLRMAISADAMPLAGDNKTIIVTFLTSYEHMGQAELSCVTGCSCNTTRFDGHALLKQSVPVIHEFTLLTSAAEGSLGALMPSLQQKGVSGVSSSSSGCVVQIEVLQSSNSGEHKVKVLQLAIKTWVNVSHILYGD